MIFCEAILGPIPAHFEHVCKPMRATQRGAGEDWAIAGRYRGNESRPAGPR